MRVGDATWRLFGGFGDVAIADVGDVAGAPRWKCTSHGIRVGDASTDPLIDLGDGRVLARRTTPRPPVIVVLKLAELAEISATQVGMFRYSQLASTQSLDEIPVVGRSLVEVLTYALDHGRLPEATHTLASAP